VFLVQDKADTGQESTVASIRSRQRSDGTWAYTVVIYEEAKTFSRKGAAEKWARARQVALEDPATLAQARVGATGKLTLSSLIKWYRETFRPLANCGRDKEESLKRLERIRSAVKTPSPSTARGSSSSSRGAE